MPDVATQAAALLDAVVAHLPDVPDRRYVADGLPAFDCDQLTVHLAGLHKGVNAQNRPDLACAPVSITAVVTRTWCVPTVDDRGRVPTTAAAHASGLRVAQGGSDLWDAVSAAARTLNHAPQVLGAQPMEPQGGLAGWTVMVAWPRQHTTT